MPRPGVGGYFCRRAEAKSDQSLRHSGVYRERVLGGAARGPTVRKPCQCVGCGRCRPARMSGASRISRPTRKGGDESRFVRAENLKVFGFSFSPAPNWTSGSNHSCSSSQSNSHWYLCRSDVVRLRQAKASNVETPCQSVAAYHLIASGSATGRKRHGKGNRNPPSTGRPDGAGLRYPVKD